LEAQHPGREKEHLLMNLTKVSRIRYVFGLSHVLTFVLVIRLVHVHVLEEFYFMQNKLILRDALFDTSESKPSEGKPLEHTPSRKCVKVSMILAMGVGTAHGSL
jgi:Trk-type K+ transport system membrane component